MAGLSIIQEQMNRGERLAVLVYLCAQFRRLTVAGSVSLGMTLLCWAQAPTLPEVSALRISPDDTPNLDGVLDEAVWQKAPLATDFVQRDPSEGDPASEATEVRVLYSDTAIYFGILCLDSSPELIRRTELRRDDPFDNDDSFGILLDTFHDHRNAFVFRINPLGARFDALITDEGRDLNVEWDEKWRAQASVNERGWAAEVEIPLKSLRSRNAELLTWGLDFERIIRRKNEETYWSNWSRDYQLHHVSQAGHLTGLQEVKTGLRLRVKPFVVSGFSQRPGDSGSDFEDESQVGIEDVKISLTSSVTADLTINPDFAQTEVDAAQLNLTRFDLFFPEKREFFLEGAGIFEFGTERPRFGSAAPDLFVFFSRRIGLGVNEESGDEEDTIIPIFAGAKVTGDIAGFQFGALNMHTDQEGSIPQTNFGVARVKKKLLGRSYVGGILTNKITSGSNDYNRVAGVDANFVLFDKLLLRGFLTQSDTFGVKGKDLAHQGLLRWESDKFRIELNRTRIDENFNPEIGFVLRKNVIKKQARATWRPRPGISFMRQISFSTGHDWFTNQNGFLESRENDFFIGLDFESGELLAFSGNSNYELLVEPFQIHPTVTIPPGSYNFIDYSVRVRTYSGRWASGEFEVEGGTFFDGNKLTISSDAVVKFTRNLSLQLEHEYNSVKLPGGSFVAQVLNTRINYNFTTKLLTSSTIQYDNVAERFLFNFRFNYIYRPGDDLFIVYNDTRDLNPTFNGFFGGLLNRALLIKFNHSFDF